MLFDGVHTRHSLKRTAKREREPNSSRCIIQHKHSFNKIHCHIHNSIVASDVAANTIDHEPVIDVELGSARAPITP